MTYSSHHVFPSGDASQMQPSFFHGVAVMFISFNDYSLKLYFYFFFQSGNSVRGINIPSSRAMQKTRHINRPHKSIVRQINTPRPLLNYVKNFDMVV